MSMPKGDTYVVGFAAVVCVVCSLLLSATASTLKSRQDYNVELDRKINVLKSLGVAIQHEDGSRITGDEVTRLFRDHIQEVVLDGETGSVVEGIASDAVPAEELAQQKKLPLYKWVEDGRVKKVAFPVFGKGLWSTIYGYLALESDYETIKGVTFYRHGETPGLGGEVEKDWFQDNFKGKKIAEGGARVRFEVVKGSVADRYPNGNNHAVDGISGATITGNGVTKFINHTLDKYEKYFKLQRGV